MMLQAAALEDPPLVEQKAGSEIWHLRNEVLLYKMAELEALRRRVLELEATVASLNKAMPAVRPKIEEMSPEVVQSNPYR